MNPYHLASSRSLIHFKEKQNITQRLSKIQNIKQGSFLEINSIIFNYIYSKNTLNCVHTFNDNESKFPNSQIVFKSSMENDHGSLMSY